MSPSLGQLEATFARAVNVDEQRQVVEQVHYAHARTQALYRGALKGVWIGIPVTIGAALLAVVFAWEYAVWLVILPALLFVVFVVAAVALALAKWIHGYRYSKVIELQETAILAAEQQGTT